jgi:hypothetical protein
VWILVITVWLAAPGGAETTLTDALTGYPWKPACTADIGHAVAGRMQRPGVVSVAARCERER